MHYEICSRCKLGEMCIGRQSECERWRTIYTAMEEELHKMIDDYHRAYDEVLRDENE